MSAVAAELGFAAFLLVVFGPPLAVFAVGVRLTATRTGQAVGVGVGLAFLGGIVCTLAFDWLTRRDDVFIAFESTMDWIFLAAWTGCLAGAVGVGWDRLIRRRADTRQNGASRSGSEETQSNGA